MHEGGARPSLHVADSYRVVDNYEALLAGNRGPFSIFAVVKVDVVGITAADKPSSVPVRRVVHRARRCADYRDCRVPDRASRNRCLTPATFTVSRSKRRVPDMLTGDENVLPLSSLRA